MAFDFYCREELRVTNARPRDDDFSAWRMLSLVQYQLAQLCALMICGRGRIDRLHIIKDGAVFDFSGTLPSAELIKAAAGMTGADKLELHLECSTASVDIETAGIMDELDDMAENGNALWDDIYFECFTDQCGNRRTYRYGMRDGAFYHGEIPPDPAF